MNEDIFDVLIYLFENYMNSEVETTPSSDELKTELKEAGFTNNCISKAFNWLDSLALQQDSEFKSPTNFRIFCAEEIQKLDLECRDFLLLLERLDILTPNTRELVIDRAMAIEESLISIDEIKWISLIVLLSQPDDELAIAHMENIIYQEASALLN
jgi:Smg protein